MNEKNGGPAFPVVDTSGDYPNCHLGMSLRDYFAAKAMQGLLSDLEVSRSLCDCDEYDGQNFATIVATNAYGFADAMLEERKK